MHSFCDCPSKLSAERYFHSIPQFLTRRSLKLEQPTTFHLVDRAYRTRNKAAHEAQLYYLDHGSRVTVDQAAASTFLAATERAVEWIAAL